MANLFVTLDQDLSEALAEVATLAGTTKRGVIEATIAERIGRPHRDRPAVRRAWASYRDTRTE